MSNYESCDTGTADAASSEREDVWWRWVVTTCRVLQQPLRAGTRRALHDHLVRAELAGEITEFHALMIQFILAVSEMSDLAIDYLEMAEAVAACESEHAVVTEARLVHDWLRGNLEAAPRQLPTTLPGEGRAMELWRRFFGELCRMSEAETGVRCEFRGPCAA